jgi:acetolactate synthase-1/2/3 large subunit
MGAVGIRVEDPKDFKPALEKAISLDKCVILDVVTDVDALAPLAYTG